MPSRTSTSLPRNLRHTARVSCRARTSTRHSTSPAKPCAPRRAGILGYTHPDTPDPGRSLSEKVMSRRREGGFSLSVQISGCTRTLARPTVFSASQYKTRAFLRAADSVPRPLPCPRLPAWLCRASPRPERAKMVNPAEPVIGGLLVELCFAFMLYGITTLQTFMYFQKCSKDGLPLKATVATVWILESVHTGFCMQFIYDYLVVGFGDYLGLISINWGIGITILSSAGIALCVQGYYTWRVWIVSEKSLRWTVVIGFFVLLRVALGIASAVLSYIYPNWIVVRHTTSTLMTVSGGLGSAALVDILVALTLTYYLKRGKHVWHEKSNNMINNILLYAVHTGALTGTASLLCVILFALEKSSLVFLGLVMIQAKLYANSFLGSLNARSHIRRKGTLDTGHSTSSNSVFHAAPPRIPVVEVFQHTDVMDDRDNPSDDSSYKLKTLKGPALV